MKLNNDEDLLAGSEPKVKVKKNPPPTVKQKLAKKAKRTVEKHECKMVEVGNQRRRVVEQGIDKKPTLTHKQTAVLSALSLGPLTAVALCTAITSNSTTTAKETFQKTTLGPLVKDGLVLKLQVDSKTTPEYSNDKKKIGAATSIKKTLDCVPLGKENAISAGFLGGLVFGKDPAAGKRDLWRNVRHGRAVAAILTRLITCGAVGVNQPDKQRAKLYYRNPAK